MTHSAHLGQHQSTVEKTKERLQQDEVIRRIWDKECQVWGEQTAEIANRLGWLHNLEKMRKELPRLQRLVNSVQSDHLTQIVLLGMGGSSLAADCLSRIFAAPDQDDTSDGSREQTTQFTILDSTDPGAVLAYDQQIEAERVLFIVASKSGTTAETLAFFRYFYNRLVRQLGAERAGEHFIAITDPGSPLAELANQHNFRATFLNDADIGGRYAAFSYFGLVPAALAGVNLEPLLEEAHKMARICSPDAPAAGNPAIWLGAILGELANQGHDKLTLITSPSLSYFGPWLEQLVAESTGKDGRGLLPVVTEPTGLPRAYGDDRLFVHLQLASDYQQDETSPAVQMVDALEEQGYPVVHMTLLDRYEIGGQMYLWMLATAIAASLMQVNPFDQPNVEAAKARTRQFMESDGAALNVQPAATFDDLQVYGPVAGDSPGATLKAFLEQSSAGDYVAIQAYLPPRFVLLNVQRQQPETVTGLQETNEIHAALASMCARIRDTYRLATTYGYGPRYLHSTGQLHKGDSGSGLFIQFTSDYPADVPIPDEAGKVDSPASMTFGRLQRAQALGDAQALEEAGRRIIRFHLGANPANWLTALNEALGDKLGYADGEQGVGNVQEIDRAIPAAKHDGNGAGETMERSNQAILKGQTDANISTTDSDDHHRDDDRSSNRTYSCYAQANRFGYWLGSQEPYCHQTWRELQNTARQEWESTQARPWSEYVAIVRHAWNDSRNAFLTRLRNITPEGNPQGSFEDRFRRHFAESYAAHGKTYRFYAPAYHFGYDLAVDHRLRDREWAEIEDEAAQIWQQETTDLFWEDAKPAVRMAWQEVHAQPRGWPHHASEYEGFGAQFYAHFQSHLADSGLSYADYAPAYYLGYDLAVEKSHHGMPWDEIQPLARTEWEQETQQRAWGDIEEAVRYAWQTVQAQLQTTAHPQRNAAAHSTQAPRDFAPGK